MNGSIMRFLWGKIPTESVLFFARHRQLLMLAVFGVVLSFVAPHPANALAIDFTDITSQWASVSTFLIFLASTIAAGMIIMTIIKLIGRDWGEAIMYAAGAAVCGYVAAHATGWISSETGVAL